MIFPYCLPSPKDYQLLWKRMKVGNDKSTFIEFQMLWKKISWMNDLEMNLKSQPRDDERWVDVYLVCWWFQWTFMKSEVDFNWLYIF